MLPPASTPPQGRRGRPCRFPDILGVAHRLKVDASHLRRVLTGERESQRIIEALKAQGHYFADLALKNREAYLAKMASRRAGIKTTAA